MRNFLLRSLALSALLAASHVAARADAADAPSFDRAWLTAWKQKNKVWRAVHRGFGTDAAVPVLKKIIDETYVPLGVNALVLEFSWNGFQFESDPKLTPHCRGWLTRAGARDLGDFCRSRGIRVIPLLSALGHQNATTAGGHSVLIEAYPEFLEPPPPGRKSFSWCPSHPDLPKVVQRMWDELLDAFQADAFHIGMDEVDLMASPECPRCRGKNPADLYAETIRMAHEHLVGRRGVEMLIWGDMLIDNDRFRPCGGFDQARLKVYPALDRVPKDIIICDWIYIWQDEYRSVGHYLEKGFRVLPTGYQRIASTLALIESSRRQADRLGCADQLLGYLNWGDYPPNPASLAAFRSMGMGSPDFWNRQRARWGVCGLGLTAAEIWEEVEAAPAGRKVLFSWPLETPMPCVAFRHQGGWRSTLAPLLNSWFYAAERSTAVPFAPENAFEAVFTTAKPAHQGRLYAQFVLPRALPGQMPGVRFAQLLCGGRVLWEDDVARRRDRLWIEVDITEAVENCDTVELTLRFVDRKDGFSGITSFSAMRLAEAGPEAASSETARGTEKPSFDSRHIQPPPSGLPILAATSPDGFQEVARRGPWLAGPVGDSRPSFFLFHFPPRTPTAAPGSACEITLKLDVPPRAARPLWLHFFLCDQCAEIKGYRVYELLHEGRTIWEEDIMANELCQLWRRVDVSNVAEPGRPLVLNFRVADRRPVGSYGTSSLLGEFILTTENPSHLPRKEP